MGAPPSELGAVHDKVAPVAVTCDDRGAVGALGVAASVVSVVVADAGEFPALLCAVTRNE